MNLLDPLLIRLGRTMVLELNVARLQDHLEGETTADRFRLADPGRVHVDVCNGNR